jgi:DNA-binding transcriptional LysR family regulator
MEVRHLRYFVAVAEELHFSRAAERLHIAQPPLSQQIRDLETELGVLLFERTKRSVKLTSAGEVFLEEARRLLAGMERAIESARRAGRGERGRLAIGFNSSATYSVLPKLLRGFRQDFPSVEVIPRELTTSRQIESLHAGEIDAGLLYAPLKEEGLESTPVHEEPLVVALGSEHPLSVLPSLSLEDLAGEPFILPPHRLGAGLYRQIERFFERENFRPRVASEAVQLQTIVALVAGGVGVAIVPSSPGDFRVEGIVYKPLSGCPPTIEIVAAWRAGDRSPVLKNFLDSVRKFSPAGRVRTD